MNEMKVVNGDDDRLKGLNEVIDQKQLTIIQSIPSPDQKDDSCDMDSKAYKERLFQQIEQFTPESGRSLNNTGKIP